MNTLKNFLFLYCRNCQIKTHHRRILKYDWGYGCTTCDTWHHQSQLIEIQQGYAAKAILETIGSESVIWYDGTIDEFIEAAEALDMDYDYQKTIDGYDFKAWYPGDENNEAKICLYKIAPHRIGIAYCFMT